MTRELLSHPPSEPAATRGVTRRRPRLGALAWPVAMLVGVLGLTAWTWTRSGALAEAEAAYRRASDPVAMATALRRALDHLDRRPWSRPAALLAARCLSRLDFPDAAEPYYRRAGRLGRDDLHTRAYALLRVGGAPERRERAARAYREILDRHPDDQAALRNLASILITLSRWDEALDLARRLTRLPGGQLIGHRMAAMIQHSTSNPEGAIPEFRRVVALDSQLRALPVEFHPITWDQFARDLLAVGRPSEARAYLTRALARRDDPGLRTLLGEAYLQEGDEAAAERCWRQAIEAGARIGAPWLDLGRLELARKRPEAAIPLLRRAAELAPNSVEPAYSLAQAYQMADRVEEANRARARLARLRARSKPSPRGMGAMSGPRP